MMTFAGAALLGIAMSVPGGLTEMFDKSSYDFGNVPQGSVSVTKFTLKNTTQSPIRITSLHSSCRCATPSAASFVAEPGKDLVIEVRYDATTFLGPRSMTIFVAFDQPVLETVSLRVQGFSRQDVTFSPGQMDFGMLTKGATETRTATIQYAGGLDWRITEVVQSKWFDAKLSETSRQPGSVTYQVTATLKPGIPEGLVTDTIAFKTNDPSSPNLQLSAIATMQANLVASPSTLELGTIQQGDKITKRVILKAGRPFTLLSVGGATDGINVLSTQGPKTVHIVDVEFAAKLDGKVDQFIKFRTDLADEPAVPVRITADVQKK